uniref:Uncharacterized protein n=1 Tax=Solibacter usitatus (strain Ellin6076) TaxID=234267 RepID=Q01R48_SOLUE
MVKVEDLAVTLEQLQAKIAEMSRHIEFLEQRGAAAVPVQQVPPVREEPVPAGITEAELIAISAALGAYLGVRAHIRQIRLVGTAAWAQEGRVSIQASHRLQG